MARPRSEHVKALKAALERRLNDRLHIPGERFLSARAIARLHGVSYQTAHRILAELEQDGHLKRTPGAGTFLPGKPEPLRKVQLAFHRRGKLAGSFGHQLLTALERALAGRRIGFVRSWHDGRAARLLRGHFPIVWESPATIAAAVAARRFALVLNNAPPPGAAGAYIDALSCDNRSGGVWAAQFLAQTCGRSARFAVLAGPENDLRSVERVEGFRSEIPSAQVIVAGGWYLEDGLAQAGKLAALKLDGLFCCNDRLAQAALQVFKGGTQPKIVGFDDAPIAEKLGITTVGIPWHALAEQAASIAESRISSVRAPARHVILPHHIVSRRSA